MLTALIRKLCQLPANLQILINDCTIEQEKQRKILRIIIDDELKMDGTREGAMQKTFEYYSFTKKGETICII